MKSALASQRSKVFNLAAAHLRHEWVLTLCLVSALAAVIAPLLILMGLKEGTIETLRNRLVEDPVFREIKPAITRTFSPEWLNTLGSDPRVAFLTATILPASSAIYLSPDGAPGELTDLVPTAAGDPLMLENGAAIPNEGECVLSSETARILDVKPGDTIKARVTRSRSGRLEAVEEPLSVIGVLTPRAGSLAKVYTTLSFVADVEAYKEGREVARRGWPGESAHPYMSFDGLVVLTQTELNAVVRTGLAVNTGLLKSDTLTSEAFVQLTGLPLMDGWYAYSLSIPTGSVSNSSIEAVQRKLRGYDAILVPFVRDLRLQYAGEIHRVMGLSIGIEVSRRLGWPELSWGAFSAVALAPSRLMQIVIPAGHAADGGMIEAAFNGQTRVAFPLKPAGKIQGAVSLIPAELMGMLNTARSRLVTYHQEKGGLVLERAGYRGFRLYTRSIDDVPPLVELLHAEGLEVIAEVEAIERIQVLDRGLSQLFWLIAVLGVLGAVAVLVASLYAAVERERKDLGVLRLIGLSRTDVFWFPVFQGAMIALLGVGLGWLGYIALAQVINRVFADELAVGQAICRMPASYPWLALAATLVLAVVSSLVAAWKATLIEPAEAIREE